jgi:CheY-like chemotaxis protein
VHALVTDLDLPGMSELALLRTRRAEEQPGARRTLVIVCSGSPVPAADEPGDRAVHDAYLVKPVDVATLADTLHRLGVAEAASPPGTA